MVKTGAMIIRNYENVLGLRSTKRLHQSGAILTNPSLNKTMIKLIAMFIENRNQVLGNNLSWTAFNLMTLYHAYQLPVFKKRNGW